MWLLLALASAAQASDLVVDFGTGIASAPIPAESVTVSWSHAVENGVPTGEVRVDSASITRTLDDHSAAFRQRIVAQQDDASGLLTLVEFTDDASVATRLSLVSPLVAEIRVTDPGTDRATEVIGLRSDSLQVNP